MRKKILFKHSGYFTLVTYNIKERSILFETEKGIGGRDAPGGIAFQHVIFRDIIYMEGLRHIHKLIVRTCDERDWDYIMKCLPARILDMNPKENYTLYKMIAGAKPYYFLCGSFTVEEKLWKY